MMRCCYGLLSIKKLQSSWSRLILMSLDVFATFQRSFSTIDSDVSALGDFHELKYIYNSKF